MLKAKGKLLKSIREKQLVQWNHSKINSLLLIQNNGSQSAGRKIRKEMYILIVERERPPKKTYLEMVFIGIRNSQANQGRMWKSYHSKVMLGKYRSQLLNDFT